MRCVLQAPSDGTPLTLDSRASHPSHPFILSSLRIGSMRLFLSVSLPFHHHLTRLFYSNSTQTQTRVSLYFRRARIVDFLRLRLRSPSASTSLLRSTATDVDSFMYLHAIRCAPTANSALSLFRSIPTAPPPPLSLFHALASRLASSRLLPDLHSLLASFPFPPSPLDRLRYFAAAADIPSSLAAFDAIPSSPRGHRCTESYNLLISLHAAAGNDAAAVALFSQMIREGAIPNARTYTVVVDHLVRAGFLDPALAVFALLPSLRTRRTTKQYNVLAEALSSAHRFDDLKRLVHEMVVDGILPGRQMRAAIAAMREAGHTEGTEDFVRELSPDTRIGYAVDDVEAEGDSDGEEDEDTVQLKPWMDPRELARALEGWDAREVADLEAAELVWTPRLVCKLLRAFKKAETAWEFFCWVACQPGGFAHDRHTVARMVAILARAGHVELVDRLFAKARSEGILLPFATVRLVIDFYGLSKKADAAVKVFRDADSICGAVSRPNRMLLCSSLLRTMAKCRRGYDAMELLEEMMMMMDGILPDLQTYSGLMEYFAGAGDLKSVHKLFGMVRQSELKPDAYMYRVLIRSYCKQERAMLALRLFEEMRYLGMPPDKPTKTLLVKSLWKEGKLREAASVEERCEEMEGALPEALPGRVWTAGAADFKKVNDIYSSSFPEAAAEQGCISDCPNQEVVA